MKCLLRSFSLWMDILLVSIMLKFIEFFAEKVRISDWVAHQNAIFDLCWIKVTTLVL